MRSLIAALILVPVLATPAAAQLGGLGKALGKAQEVRQELTFTDAEEQALGADISAKLRDKYGVVQDPAVHKYVALVGRRSHADAARRRRLADSPGPAS
jgi:predicted Zn-dependent protease